MKGHALRFPWFCRLVFPPHLFSLNDSFQEYLQGFHPSKLLQRDSWSNTFTPESDLPVFCVKRKGIPSAVPESRCLKEVPPTSFSRKLPKKASQEILLDRANRKASQKSFPEQPPRKKNTFQNNNIQAKHPHIIRIGIRVGIRYGSEYGS